MKNLRGLFLEEKTSIARNRRPGQQGPSLYLCVGSSWVGTLLVGGYLSDGWCIGSAIGWTDGWDVGWKVGCFLGWQVV